MNSKFQSVRGRIAVYSERHRLQQSMIYYTGEGMKRIMEVWMNEYPEGYYIQVRPYTEVEKEVYRLDIVKH